MKINLVEDSKIKADKICSFLHEKYPESSIEVLCSYQSGLKKLVSDMPHLVILDMSLPTYDRGGLQREGRLRPLGGYDIMRKLSLRRVDFKVLVVTQLESFGEGEDRVSFDEMNNKCNKEFSSRYLGAVFFGQSDEQWKVDIEGILDKL